MNDLRMELKVCEGCGALWLRAGESAGVYCRSCSGRLAQFPPPKNGRVASRTRVRTRVGRKAQLVGLAGGAR